MTLDRDAFFIDGGWAAPAGADILEVVSPHSEQVVATRARGQRPADIDAAVAAARRAFDEGPWPRMIAAGADRRRPGLLRACTPASWARWPT